MKKSCALLMLCFLSLYSAAAADGVIRRLVWQHETSDPVPRVWQIFHGETVDLETRFLDHARPMGLAGSGIVLACRTNGMPADVSWQVPGSITSATDGWARVRLVVSDVIAAGPKEVTFVFAATNGITNLLSNAGVFRISGTGTGIGAAVVSAPLAAELRSEMAATVHACAIATNGFVTSSITNGLASSADVAEAVRAATNSLPSVDLSGYATETYVTSLGYVTREVTNGLASSVWVLSHDWQTAGQVAAAISSATNAIPKLSGYATRADLVAATNAVPRVSTNGLASVVYVLDVVAAGTNGLPTKDYVRQAVAAGTNGLVTAAVTNGLASRAYVGGAIAAATNHLPKADLSGYATTNWVAGRGYATPSVTNDLPTKDYVRQAVVAGTNGLVTAAVTNGLASQTYVLAMISAGTNGLPKISLDGYATESWVTNRGYVTASITNGLPGKDWVRLSIQVATNDLSRGMMTTNYVLATVSSATNGLASESFALKVASSVTNGLAGTNWVNSQVATMMTPTNGYGFLMWDAGASEWLIVTCSNRVFVADTSSYQPGPPLITRDGLATTAELTGATNSLPQLLSFLKSDYGYTTQQVWRIGGSVVTNFFTRAGGAAGEYIGTNEVYVSYGWTRPNDWPVGAGYTNVVAWRTPELRKLKMIVEADEYECVSCMTEDGSSVTIDWGDGTEPCSYNSGTTMSHVYSGSVLGHPVAVVAMAGTNFSNVAGNPTGANNPSGFPTVGTGIDGISGSRQAKFLEIIFPFELSSFKYNYAFSDLYRLQSVVGNLRVITAYSFSGCSGLQNIVMPDLIQINYRGLASCIRLTHVNLPSLKVMYSGAFFQNYSLRTCILPSLANAYETGHFSGCNSLSDPVNLSALTLTADDSDLFYHCNFSFAAITNMIGMLPKSSTMRTIGFSGCPGAADALIWYQQQTNIVSRNWTITF